MTSSPVVVEACLRVLRLAPAALITDIDGTISAIAPTPADAFVHPEARIALEVLATRLAAVAVVSGRAPEVGAAMVGLPDLIYVGNHGLERIMRGAAWTHLAAEDARPAIAAALAEVAAAVHATQDAPWLLVENKGVTGTLHYRLAADPAAAAALLEPLARAAAARHGLRVTLGRMIVELRPDLAVNKGTAILDLVNDLALRGVVFFGDDATDVDGFRVLRALRETGQVATLNVGVLGPETPLIVREAVDVTVNGVADTAATLAAIATHLARD